MTLHQWRYRAVAAVATIATAVVGACIGASSAAAYVINTSFANTPAVTLTVTPTTIAPGQSAILSWNATNASHCVGQGFSLDTGVMYPGGVVDASSPITGSMTVSPTQTTAYSITCQGSGTATAVQSATLTVTPASVVNPPSTTPTVTLTATPATISSGGNSTLSWNATNAAHCDGNGFSTSAGVAPQLTQSGTTGDGTTIGSVNVSPAATTAYSITCTNNSTTHGIASATVTVQPTSVNPPISSAPSVTLTATPSVITPGSATTLSWNAINATSCTGNGFSTNTGTLSPMTGASIAPGNGTSGSVTLYPATTSTYSISCTNGGAASAASSATVYVQSGTTPSPITTPQSVTLTANPTIVSPGQSSTLAWNSSNADYCEGQGFSTGGGIVPMSLTSEQVSKGSGSTSGSVTVTPPATTDYSITCYNGSVATAIAAARVAVYGTVSPLTNPSIDSPGSVSGSSQNASASGAATSSTAGNNSCAITHRLMPGSSGDEVRCLQQLLAADPSIYPEGLITGYFGTKTEAAVQRFQVAHNIVTGGTPQATGYGAVGAKTRAALGI